MHNEHVPVTQPRRRPDMRPCQAAAAHILDRAFHDDPRITPETNGTATDIDWGAILYGRWPLTNDDAEHCDNWAHHFSVSEWALLEMVANLLGEPTDRDVVDVLPLLNASHYSVALEAFDTARAAGSI